MISLSRHIELLLLEHDCVIVPGLGGFIANPAEAKYSSNDEHLFLPPFRTIGFNPQLQVNDGLLVQSYMALYDASYPAAQLQMEQDIEKMMLTLEMNGTYELGSIGTLSKQLDNHITFTAPETGLLTPALYGLYSYEIKPLEIIVKEQKIARMLREATSTLPQGSQGAGALVNGKRKERPIIVRIPRGWLDAGIAAAAAVLLFFGLSFHTLHSTENHNDTVVATFNQMEHPATHDSAKKHTASDSAKKHETTGTKTTKGLEATNNKTTADTPVSKTQYTIVLASHVGQKNAENFIERLTKAGFADGQYTKTGKVSRIIYSSFDSEEEAQVTLKSLRQQNKSFDEAWIMELLPPQQI